VATFALVGGEKKQDCNAVVTTAENAIPNEGEFSYRNHGRYVRTVAHYLRDTWPNISEACHDCVMAGAANSDLGGTNCSIPQ